MSLMSDIRKQMASSSGPVKPAEIAEALEIEPVKVRNAMYQASNQEAGIERHDDGTYSLVPGWKPRGAEAEAANAAPTPARSKKPRKAGAARTVTPRKPKKAKPAAARKPTKRSAAPRSPKPRRNAATPAPAPAAAPLSQVEQLKAGLARLVLAVVGSGQPIEPALRASLRDAAALAA